MRSPYNETIRFPNQLDRDFPSLADNTTPWVEQRNIVYPEHYNKLVNLVGAMQNLTTGAPTASGDGTLQRISYPYVITVPIATIAQSVAPAAYSSTTINNPGNVLPFEFVFTFSQDIYSSYDTSHSIVVQLTQEDFDSFIGGDGFFSTTPLCTASLVALGGAETTLHLSNYVLTSHVIVGVDTVLVRGAIIDLAITGPDTATDPWDIPSRRWQDPGVNVGVKVAFCGIA